MKFMKYFMCIIAFVLVLTSASALSVTGIPSSINFYQTVKEVEFSVTNATASNQNLVVEVYAPMSYEVVAKPEWIAPSRTEDVIIKFIPDETLIGTKYTSTIYIKLGTEDVEKKIYLSFKELMECPLEIKTAKIESDVNGLHELNLKITVENKSVEDIDVEFLGLVGMPADWEYRETGTITFSPALSTREMELDFEFGSSFDGVADVTFNCGEFGRVKKSISLEHEEQENLDFFAGLLVLGGSSGELELALDAVLIVVAAILLIAFISRFVKRYTVKELKRKGEMK